MKYILTKDKKIHEVALFFNSRIYLVKTNPSDGTDIFGDCGYSQEHILKESDSIEELCDYFLFDDAFECLNPSIYASASTARDHAKYHESIIGYIVIEKNGVKTIEPVAKTNNEGKFELL